MASLPDRPRRLAPVAALKDDTYDRVELGLLDRLVRHRFTIAAGSRGVWLASRSTVPAETAAAAGDIRRLGVAVERIALHDAGLSIEAEHGHATLCEGFHEDEGSHRWTDGLARLPESWLRPFPDGATLDVHLSLTELGYRLPPPIRIGAAAA